MVVTLQPEMSTDLSFPQALRPAMDVTGLLLRVTVSKSSISDSTPTSVMELSES